MSSNLIAIGKIEAYMAAEYRVSDGDVHFTMRIGELCEQLFELMAAKGHINGVYITAFNPLGEARDEQTNLASHLLLGEVLRGLSEFVFEGVGGDPNGEWPDEKSYLALGIHLQEAKRLGREAFQDAIVFIEQDAIPQLLILR